MGSVQSAKRRIRSFPLLHSSTSRYHRLSNSSALLNQPLLRDENLSVETKHEIQAYWEKCSALEKEIHGLKSNFDRLKTTVQTSISKLQSRPTSEAEAIEGEKQEALIASLKEMVDKLKKRLDGEIMAREADKRAYSASLSNQGSVIKRVEEKNIDVEKEIAELKTVVNEMKSSMVDLAAVTAELKLESRRTKEAPKSAELRIPKLRLITALMDVPCIILIFLIGFLIGQNI
ncbi:uncharacterized protein LOC133299411 [Gastrolobium bilobum]|uniref:uncharacterized protein LOC133299411 n=1 Tax=Gastrolobium bilobum TaxID=150636 RepID=UPI002AB1C50F|nr:uncharacterized protein LOC133299411 [Gastrolobium bilobum]